MPVKKIVYAVQEHEGNHPRLGPDNTILDKQVICHGFSEFEINETNEAIDEKNVNFNPKINIQDWFRNPTSGDYQQTPPE